jgi:hypothetical protein
MIKLNLKILNLNIVSMKIITTILNTIKSKKYQLHSVDGEWRSVLLK